MRRGLKLEIVEVLVLAQANAIRGLPPASASMSFADQRTSVPGGDCHTGYAIPGSARIADLTEYVTALSGFSFGSLDSNTTVGGMPCFDGTASTDLAALPANYAGSLPNLVILDEYACLNASPANGACAQAPQLMADTRTEAITSFSAIQSYVNSAMPGAKILIQETHSPTSQTNGLVQGFAYNNPIPSVAYTCENDPAATATPTLLGMLQSTANGNPGGTIIEPFYNSGDPCYAFPAAISPTYSLTQR